MGALKQSDLRIASKQARANPTLKEGCYAELRDGVVVLTNLEGR